MSDSAVFPVIQKDVGMSEVIVTIEVHADSELQLLEALCRAMADRDIPPEECVGAIGWRSTGLPTWGAVWSHDRRLHPEMAVIWHPAMIIPPAVVLDPKAVIYGRIGHSAMVRYRS